MKIIHRPILSDWDFFLFRTQGPGLGNLLFPLYRAFQSQKKMGGELVFPQFRQIKIGPYLRQEKDKRTYGNIFATRTFQDLTLQAQSLFSSKINESELTDSIATQLKDTTTVLYKGLGNYFKDFDKSHREDFEKFLLARAKNNTQLYRLKEDCSPDHVAIHLRLGDFSAVSKGQSQEQQMNARTDIEWYQSNVNHLLSINPNLKLTLFTDEAELPRSYHSMLGNPKLDKSKNALEAILHMSSHPIIIGSKSSFSLWAAYLGNSELRVPKEFDIERYTTPDAIKSVGT